VREFFGTVIPGVHIALCRVETGTHHTTFTDAEGRYLAADLESGVCEIEPDNEGFATEVRRGVEVTVGREAGVDF
jgi:hypothetical protein